MRRSRVRVEKQKTKNYRTENRVGLQEIAYVLSSTA